MSLGACIPDMLKRGEIDPTRAARMKTLFDELERQYRTRMSPAAAAAEASEKTLTKLVYEARLKKRQTLLQVTAQHRLTREMESFAGGGHDKYRSAAAAVFDRDWKGRAQYGSIEGRRRAIVGQAHAMMADVLERHHRGFVTGGQRNKADLVDLEREAFGEDSGNAAAKELAAAWDDTAEWLRQRANAAGADIGKLDKWGFPQRHNSQAVREAADANPEYRALEAELKTARAEGRKGDVTRIGDRMVDMASQSWRDFITPRLDRARMIDKTTGEAFTPEALDAALDGVFRTIRTDGWEGRALGAMGGSKLASSLSEERFLIFKDAAGWSDYNERFGAGNSFDAMNNHIERMARDVAHMELLGPSPAAQVKWMNDLVESKRQLTPDSKKTGQKADGLLVSIDNLFATTSGALSAPVDPNFAKRIGSARNLLVAAQLGSAVVTAVPTDIAFSTLARVYRGLPIMRGAWEFAQLLKAGDRHDAIASGLIAEEASRSLQSGNRFVADEQIGAKSGWLAERLMNLSLIAPWTQTARWTFGRGMQAELGKQAARPLDQVPARFQQMLREYGLSNGEWEQVRKTALTDGVFLEPMKIENRGLRDRVLEMILMETDAAVPATTVTGRAALSFGQRPGSAGGEFLRSIGQYKSFGVSLIQMQAGRIMAEKGAGNKLLYLAGLSALGTAGGLIANWARDIRSGNDPQPLDEATIGKAFLTGVGFGVFGDYLTAVTSDRAGAWPAAVAGPLVGATGEFGEVAVGSAFETYKWAKEPDEDRDGDPKTWNEQTHAGRKAVRLVKRYTPGTNIWYARKAAKVMLWDQLQYLFDDNAQQSFDQASRNRAREGRADWWQPGQMAPERAPNMDLGRERDPDKE